MNSVSTKDILQIKMLLMRFQEGYNLRNTESADSFVDELYSLEDSTVVLGTGTGELLIGREKITELIKDDWSYWGDVKLKVEVPYIEIDEDVAWIEVQGSVKYSFEDSPTRYDSYLNFIKQRLENSELSAEQRITFLNWALMLTYHQREDKKREYLWPLCLSGVLRKVGERWCFVQQHFSISVADYPDERFEASHDHLEAFNKQNSIAFDYKENQRTKTDMLCLKDMEQTLFGKGAVTEEDLKRMFSDLQDCLVIGVDHKEYRGMEQIKAYFERYADCKVSLAKEHAIVAKHKDLTWITATGIMEQEFKKDIQFEEALQLLKSITESDASSKDKIFLVQKRIAYLLKEVSFGDNYTYPLRLSFVLNNSGGKTKLRMLHLSHPSYWVFEGKLS